MKELEEIAEMVARERLSRGWSQKELAAKASIGDSTLERIEQARPPVPTERIMQKIAIAFGRSYDGRRHRFYNGHSPAEPPPSIEPVALGPVIPEWTVEICASAWVEIPICQLDENDPEQRQVIAAGRFRLRIIGRCMEPDYQDGQVIEFQIVRWDHVTPLEIGVDYVVCRSDGMATFKRLVKVDEDTLSLAALNQKDYPGLLVVNKQDVVRLARVAFRLVGPPPASVPKIKMPARVK